MPRFSRPQPSQHVCPPSREALTPQIEAICAAVRDARAGDLESRVPPMADPVLSELRTQVNGLLDVVDAFMRDAVPALDAATRGEFHRRLLTRGLPGAFGQGAAQIDTARGMLERAQAARNEQQGRLVQQAATVSTLVNEASGALAQSASGVVAASRLGAEEVARARATMREMETASQTIGTAATLIRDVAARTRLLALNATIEAARAGEVGRGFAVVAGEVKSLADEVSASSDEITANVTGAQRAASDAVAAMERVEDVISTVTAEADAIAVASGQGLADMAQRLQDELARFDRPAAT